MEEKTSAWVKFGVVAGFIILIASLLLIIKWQHDSIIEQKELYTSQMKNIGDGIIKSQEGYLTKDDLEKYSKSFGVNLDKIQADLDKLGADVKEINVIVSSTPGKIVIGAKSDGKIPIGPGLPPGSKCDDPYGYLTNAQVKNLEEQVTEKDSVPLGDVTFKSWEPKPWDYQIFPRKYSIATVMGEDEEGKRYAYNKFSVEVKGKKYEMPITQADLKQQFPESKFRFSPRLYLGLDVGARVNPLPAPEAEPNLQVSLFSYGRTKPDPDWTFLGIGLGFESVGHLPTIVLSPANYNVGHPLPLVDNLHIGPTVSVDTMGSFAVMGGIRVGL